MAMSLKSLERLVQAAFGPEFKYKVDPEQGCILAGVVTEHYVDRDGEHVLDLRIKRVAKGRYIEIVAPAVYNVAECPHVHAVCRTLLGICLRTAVLQYAIDEASGDVIATVEIILADGVITVEQLRENMEHLVGGIDSCHEHVDLAMRTGEITFPKERRPRTVLPVTGRATPEANLDTDTEEVLRGMWRATMEAGQETWKQARVSGEEMRHW